MPAANRLTGPITGDAATIYREVVTDGTTRPNRLWDRRSNSPDHFVAERPQEPMGPPGNIFLDFHHDSKRHPCFFHRITAARTAAAREFSTTSSSARRLMSELPSRSGTWVTRPGRRRSPACLTHRSKAGMPSRKSALPCPVGVAAVHAKRPFYAPT